MNIHLSVHLCTFCTLQHSLHCTLLICAVFYSHVLLLFDLCIKAPLVPSSFLLASQPLFPLPLISFISSSYPHLPVPLLLLPLLPSLFYSPYRALDRWKGIIGKMQHAWLVYACKSLGLTKFLLPLYIKSDKVRYQE